MGFIEEEANAKIQRLNNQLLAGRTNLEDISIYLHEPMLFPQCSTVICMSCLGDHFLYIIHVF